MSSNETEESSTVSDDTLVQKKRGRPRKNPTQQHFNPVVYNSPLGYQYAQAYQPFFYPMFNPMLQVHPAMYNYYQPPPRRAKDEPAIYVPEKRQKRSAAVVKKVQEVEEESFEAEEEEEDNIEKLLDYDKEKDEFLVKFRHQSYLHCGWLPRSEVARTKNGLIKTKRFRPQAQAFDPEFIKVDRVLHEEYDKEKLFLIKWCSLPYELSTYETAENATKCEFFEEQLKAYRDRKKTKTMRVPLDWRPSRENYLKFHTSPEFKNGNKLREYQLEGLNWLLNRWYHKQSCIMADEMGLGKTVQSVTFVNVLFTKFDYVAPILVVAPLITIIHWEREFKGWTNLRVLIYHGSIQGRETINEYEFHLKTPNLTIRLFDVIITTYEMVMAGSDHLSQFSFSVGIFDEAHRLKNPNSKAATVLRSLSFNHKVLLSGTPLQNNITELWALLNYIDRTKFSNLNLFLQEFKMENIADVEKLQALLRPLMLRRMKEDVEKSIPMKEETIIEVELTMIQKRFYRAILEKNIGFLTKGNSAPNLLNAMMELRKCCIHPYLIKGAEEKILGEHLNRKKLSQEEKSFVDKRSPETIVHTIDTSVSAVACRDKTSSKSKIEIKHYSEMDEEDMELMQDCKDLIGSEDDPAAVEPEIEKSNVKSDFKTITNKVGHLFEGSIITDIDEYYKILIQSSGKLVLLDKLLNKLHGKHKVLIFSQMTRCLDLLADYLTYRKYKYERIDGGVRGDYRQAAIDRFSNQGSDVFVFLLCTRAGGVGINLTAADTVIIFDSDWNPQNDLQAQARCHRIGQTNEVKIYRLITRNTYEREMFDKAGLKLGLDRAVLQKMTFEGQKNEKVKKKDAIEMLLRKGAYGVLMETDDASRKFCEEDIDQILERRTKIIKHSESGNVFSKATFQVDDDIDDDPDFWENLLSKKRVEESEGRVKRQMRRLSRDGNLSYEEVKEIKDRMKADCREEPDMLLKIFCSVILNGLNSIKNDSVVDNSKVRGISNHDRAKAVATAKQSKNLTGCEQSSTSSSSLVSMNCTPLQYFNYIVKYLTDQLLNSKLRADYSMGLEEHLADDYDPSLFSDHKEFYKTYGEKFLLRVQVINLLNSLYETEELWVEKSRGWNSDDDKTLIELALTCGYGNYSVRNKSVDELNQRLRKIVLCLNKKKETRENDDLFFKTIMNFGRVTELNEQSVLKFMGDKDINALRENINKIMNSTRRGRSNTTDSLCYERISFFDKLMQIIELPKSRKDVNNAALKNELLKNGLNTVKEKFGLTEEVVVRKVETWFKVLKAEN